jgi:hypothetical protein
MGSQPDLLFLYLCVPNLPFFLFPFQCRNITPCLSYSRFHLDIVNLHPFVQSLIDKDAPEIDHEEVLWNLTSELIKRVDGVFDKVQVRVKAGQDEGDLITEQVVDTVNILRTLRHFVREVARRKEISQLVKGSEANPNEHNYEMLVDDVDMVRLTLLRLFMRMDLLCCANRKLANTHHSFVSVCMSSVIDDRSKFLHSNKEEQKHSKTFFSRREGKAKTLSGGT